VIQARQAPFSSSEHLLDRWRDRLGIDDEFAANVATAGNVPVALDVDPWRE
jgi:hypothetical protein